MIETPINGVNAANMCHPIIDKIMLTTANATHIKIAVNASQDKIRGLIMYLILIVSFLIYAIQLLVLSSFDSLRHNNNLHHLVADPLIGPVGI